MKRLLLLSLVWVAQNTVAQEIVFRNPKDSTQNFYQQYLPNSQPRGLIVVFYAQFQNPKLVTDRGFMLVSLTPQADYLQTMFGTALLKISSEMIDEICKQNHIPTDKVIVGGLSAAGTLALRLAEESHNPKRTKLTIKPAAVFAIDPPLDYERFWYECQRKVKLNFHPAAVSEGQEVLRRMKAAFGGSPAQFQQKYWSAAPYSRNAPDGGQIVLLRNTAIRIYHEPDVDWWIENRRQDYVSMNSVDCAGAINDLRILGNSRAQLISTTKKGYREDGTRHPHSWAIVDEKELVDWCAEVLK